jgi:hypothetical protein
MHLLHVHTAAGDAATTTAAAAAAGASSTASSPSGLLLTCLLMFGAAYGCGVLPATLTLNARLASNVRCVVQE